MAMKPSSSEEDVLVVSKHALPLVLSVRQWKKSSNLRAIEVFGGHVIRQHTSQLLSIVRQKTRSKFLLPWNDNWDELLLELTLLLLEEENQISQLVLGAELHWGRQQFSKVFRKAAEQDVFVNVSNNLDQVLGNDNRVRQWAKSCGFIVHSKSMKDFQEGTRGDSEHDEMIACTKHCFREFDKLLISSPSMLRDIHAKLSCNTIKDLHDASDRFMRIHVISDGSTCRVLGVTMNLYKRTLADAIVMPEGLRWIPRTTIELNPHFHHELLSNEQFREMLFRFCEQTQLEGLYSIEFVTKHASDEKTPPSERFAFHQLIPNVMEDVWLLEQQYQTSLLQLHSNCLNGSQLVELKPKNASITSFVHIYARNSFHFRVKDWNHFKFFEHPVEDVTIPQGIHWSTMQLETRTANDMTKKLSAVMSSLDST